MRVSSPLVLAATAVLATGAATFDSAAAEERSLAFVVNAASDFWKLAEAASTGRRRNCRATTFSSAIRRKGPRRCRTR